MGGYQVSGGGSGDDGYDEDGYDESQRAEILEATRDGPSNGAILTDLAPDLGGDVDEDEDDDDLLATSRDGSTVTRGQTDDDIEEDELQDDYDNDKIVDVELDEADDAALEP